MMKIMKALSMIGLGGYQVFSTFRNIRIGRLNKKSYYTRAQLDAINYFRGTGFYKKQQDLKVKPNKFDTRQSFLRKIHDPIVINKFLNNLNRFSI